MPPASCKVSFTDSDGLLDTAHVRAESVHEAVAMAVSEFRADPLAPPLGPMTEFVIAVEKPPVEHRIRLAQLQTWAETTTTREGPAGITKRQRIKALLG